MGEPEVLANDAVPGKPADEAATAPLDTEHPTAPGQATMVPAESSHADVEQRESAADAATTRETSAAVPPANSAAKSAPSVPDVGQPNAAEAAAEELAGDDDDEIEEEQDPTGHVEPLEFIDETLPTGDLTFDWFILKVAVNREDSIKDALLRRVRMNGLEPYFRDIVVPTEDVKEFTKTGKPRVVKKKLYPGYILINMSINDESWFVVRETPGIGDFTGAGGKPTPMLQKDVDRILKLSRPPEEGPGQVQKTTIPFVKGDRVRVKEGYFQNFEGDVDVIDEANGRVTVLVNIFGRSAPVELDHWQIEKL